MKNKNLFIEFNNTFPKLIDVFPEPEPSIKNIPEWYRLQPSYYNNDTKVVNGQQQLTIKKCLAVFDAMTSGYLLKCPVDIYIDTTQDNPIFQIAPHFNNLQIPIISYHAKEQVSHYPIDKEKYIDFILRINLVWVVSTPKGYSSLFIAPQHNESSPINAISAIIDTDEFYSAGAFSFIVEKGYKGIIKRGTPLVQVLPFKRERWNSKINKNFDVHNTLRHQMYKVRSIFNGGYKNFFWHKKEYK
jgi:hypothetical protein